jgi:hypothetical protein
MINPRLIKRYKNNSHLKAAGMQIKYDKHQIEERIKCTQDPLYFIQNYLKIVHVDRGLVPFKLYDFQKDLLKTYVDNRFVCALLPRQVGKCVHNKTIITILYKKEYLITLEIGKLYEIAKEANFEELLNLSKSICENENYENMLFRRVQNDTHGTSSSKYTTEDEAEKSREE